MKRTPTIRKGVHLDLLNRAVVAFGGLQRVLEGDTSYHTYLAWIRECQKNGIPLSDIGTSDEEIESLCQIGSQNVVKMHAKLLEACTEAHLEDSVSAAQEIIADEVRCGHISLQDLTELGLVHFAIHLPAEGEVW